MKEVHKSDAEGLLFDPRVRAALTAFAGEDTLALEASAAVRSAAHAVDRLRSRGADGRGVSSGALDLLMRLAATDGAGITIGDLARSAGVSSRNVTGLVDTLEKDGLVKRLPDPRDRRSVLASITPGGRAWVESFREPTRRAMAALFAGFDAAELAQLRHLCLRLIENQQRIEAATR